MSVIYSCECKEIFRKYMGKEARMIREEIERAAKFDRELEEETRAFWSKHKSLAYWARRKGGI